MMKNDDTTPRPWSVGEELAHVTVTAKRDDRTVRVATINGHPLYPGVKEDAALIVRAVNRDHLFDEMVAALEDIEAADWFWKDVPNQPATRNQGCYGGITSAVLAKVKAVQS